MSDYDPNVSDRMLTDGAALSILVSQSELCWLLLVKQQSRLHRTPNHWVAWWAQFPHELRCCTQTWRWWVLYFPAVGLLCLALTRYINCSQSLSICTRTLGWLWWKDEGNQSTGRGTDFSPIPIAVSRRCELPLQNRSVRWVSDRKLLSGLLIWWLVVSLTGFGSMVGLSWIGLDMRRDGYCANGWVKVYNPTYNAVYGG